MGSYQKAPQKGITKLQYLFRGSFVSFLFQLTIKDLDEEGLYELQENGEVYSGAELMYAGLTVILSQGDFLSRQYIFRRL